MNIFKITPEGLVWATKIPARFWVQSPSGKWYGLPRTKEDNALVAKWYPENKYVIKV